MWQSTKSDIGTNQPCQPGRFPSWADVAYAHLLLVSFNMLVISHPITDLQTTWRHLVRKFSGFLPYHLDLGTFGFIIIILRKHQGFSISPYKSKGFDCLEITCSTPVDIGYYSTTSPSLINWVLGEGGEGMCTQVVSGYPNWCAAILLQAVHLLVYSGMCR